MSTPGTRASEYLQDVDYSDVTRFYYEVESLKARGYTELVIDDM